MDKTAVNKRFITAVDKLLITGKAISKASIAEKLNISSSKFSEILKERMNVGVDLLALISEIYDISTDWLLTGKGGMFRSSSETLPASGYPLLSMEAFAGPGDCEVFGDELQRVTERYDIPLFKGLHVDFMISVKGSSMYPKYNSGDVVACRIINEVLFIQWNKVYVLDTKSQGVILKRLKPSDNPDMVICKSDNESYDPFEIPKTDICKMAMVVGVVRLE